MRKNQPTSHLLFARYDPADQISSHRHALVYRGWRTFVRLTGSGPRCGAIRAGTAPPQLRPPGQILLCTLFLMLLAQPWVCATLPQFRVVPSLTADVRQVLSRLSAGSSHVITDCCNCTCCAVVSLGKWMVTDDTVCLEHTRRDTCICPAVVDGMSAGPSPWDGQCRIDGARRW
jgi:hypothetical protein